MPPSAPDRAQPHLSLVGAALRRNGVAWRPAAPHSHEGIESMSTRAETTAARSGWQAAVLLVLCALALPATAQPAFPGAEGFGARASGGRGGAVLRVTNLNASGPGSLQAAVNTAGARIVVFTVSGTISGDLHIPHGNLTIAGQTAPGAGITLLGHLYTDYPTTFGNIVIRHLRIRPPMPDAEWPAAQHDAVQMSANRLIMLDHVDISHGVDENLDLYEGARDITVQWSNISFPVRGGGHPDGAEHNFGMLNGPDGGRISAHHTLFAHNKRRTPAIADGPADVVNNVIYNAREGFVHNNPARGQYNLVGNTYKDGPSATLLPFFFDPENSNPPLQYFSSGNAVDAPGAFVGTVGNPYTNTAFADEYDGFACCGVTAAMFDHANAFDFSANAGYVPITTQPAEEAYACVLALAGAWPRDVITRRSVDETAARNGSWGNHRPADWLEGLAPGTAPADSDADGMPDAWELSKGLNPNSAADVHADLPGDYDAIETWLNERAEQLLPGAAAPVGDPDRVFANGFEATGGGGSGC
jgi:pectate lyase